MEEIVNAGARREAVRAVNEFSCALYKEVQRQPGNLFLSPFSVHALLTMVLGGASGETAAELARGLGWKIDSQAVSTLRALPDAKTGTESLEMVVANALWAHKGVAFSEPFAQAAKSVHQAELRTLDFHQAEAASGVINDWVAEKTRDKIRNIVSANEINPETLCVLVNAIYFKAKWETKFSKYRTVVAPFHLEEGGTSEVLMMRGSVATQGVDEPRFVGTTLKYRGGSFAMHIFVPRETQDLRWLEEHLMGEGPNAWNAYMQDRAVDLSLPRFEFSSQYLVGQMLKAIGIHRAFNSTVADFSGVFPNQPLWISDMLHKTYIRVDEDGTEAAAATRTYMAGGIYSPPPLEVKADRPFLFAITCTPWTRHGEEEPVILFMGRVMRPTAPTAADLDEIEARQKREGIVVGVIAEDRYRVRMRDGRVLEVTESGVWIGAQKKQLKNLEAKGELERASIWVYVEFPPPPELPRIARPGE